MKRFLTIFPPIQVSYNATIGSEIVQRTATLNVPANIVDGHFIRLKGWGGSSSKGSPCGDLVTVLFVTVGASACWEKEGTGMYVSRDRAVRRLLEYL